MSNFKKPDPKVVLAGTSYEDCECIFEGDVRGLNIPDDLSKEGLQVANIMVRSFKQCGIKVFNELYIFSGERLKKEIAYFKKDKGWDQSHHVLHFGVDSYFLGFLRLAVIGGVMRENLRASGYGMEILVPADMLCGQSAEQSCLNQLRWSYS